jgi:site-specific recombinase XerD
MLTKTHLDPPLSKIVSETVDYLINAFLLDRRSQGVSRGTLRAYTQELTYFSTYIRFAGVEMMDEITPDVLRRYLIDLSTHRNPGGVNIAYRVIKTFTYWWERETDNEYRSPIRKVKTPKNPTVPLKGIEPSEVLQLINACKGNNEKRDRAVLLTLFDTGVRANELIMIDIGSLALPEGRIHIIYGKGSKQRDVFIGRGARRAIRQYLKERENLYPGTPLFVTGDGERLTYTSLKMIIRRRSKQAGLTKIHYPHDFRRGFALECLRNHLDINTIMRLMGHSSPAVVQRYLSQTTEDLHRAHERASPVDNIIFG